MHSLLVIAAIAQFAQPDLRFLREVNMAVGQAAMAKRDFKTAQIAYEAAVAADPNDGFAAFQLGSALLSEANTDPVNIRTGSFYYARAAILLGNDQVKSWVKRQYSLIYKTPLGLDAYWDFVRRTPLAPASAEEFPPAPLVPFDNNMFYDILRAELKGPNANVFFEDVLRGNRLQRFRGKLVSQSPELNPGEFVLTMRETGDLRVFVNPPLKGKADPGTMIDIDEATVRGFRRDPFRIELELSPEAMRGWPGMVAPVPPPPQQIIIK